jgi:arginyl-tRNA synthetase
VLTRDLRDAIARALATAGLAPADPGLRPTGVPGQYASSVVLTHPRAAATLAAALAAEPWVGKAELTGPGYLTITVTPEALAALPERIAAAGPGCAASDALRGVTVPAPPAADPLAAAGWEEARQALAAQVTARLAAAAGATIPLPRHPERTRAVSTPTPSRPGERADDGGGARDRSGERGAEPDATGQRQVTDVAAAVAFAGADAVLFALARAVPGRAVRIDPGVIARHVPDNPAYAVRYAHARAASGVRWAAIPIAAEAALPRPPADPGELALLDALSWLPERVATAARRGRPDEFARYLEELASVSVAALTSGSHQGGAGAPGSDKFALARAAQAGLAAGLELLGVSAPERL